MKDRAIECLIALGLVALLIACAITCNGCTSTYIRTPSFTAYRISVLQKVGFNIRADDHGIVVNYGNSGGSESLASAAKIGAALVLH